MDTEMDNNQDFTLDIEDYSGRNFDADVLDTIVENSHSEPYTRPEMQTAQYEPAELAIGSDDILDEDHWANDSFDELKVDQEY